MRGLRADDHQAFDQVAQFADISGPGVAEQDVHGGVAELAVFFAVGGAEFVEEITREHGDVFHAIAQRRHEEGNYVEAVEEVLAEMRRGRFPVRDFCWWRR